VTVWTGTHNVTAQPRTPEERDAWREIIDERNREWRRGWEDHNPPSDPPAGWCPECGVEALPDPGTPWYRCPGCDASLDEEDLLANPPEDSPEAHHG